jgi:cysteine synthase B
VGISSAAAVAASLEIAEAEAAAHREAVVVTILCDSADKYLSEHFWSDATAADGALLDRLQQIKHE